MESAVGETVVLKVTVLSVLVDARLALPAASVAAPASTLATTTPVPVIPDTATLYVGPAPLTTAVSAPPTVLPAKLMSFAAKPVTASLKVTVKLIGFVFGRADVCAACTLVTRVPTSAYATDLSV